jgi:hypothetical protein
MTNARVRSAIEVLLGYLCKIEVIDRAVQSYRSILHFHLRSGPIDQEHMLHCFNLIKKKRSWRISPARTLCFSFVAFVFVKSAYLCTASTYWNACIVFSWHHPPARSCDHAGKVYDAQILLVAQDGNFSGFMDPPPPAAPNVPYNTLDMNMGGRGYHGPGSGVNRQNVLQCTGSLGRVEARLLGCCTRCLGDRHPYALERCRERTVEVTSWLLAEAVALPEWEPSETTYCFNTSGPFSRRRWGERALAGGVQV